MIAPARGFPIDAPDAPAVISDQVADLLAELLLAAVEVEEPEPPTKEATEK